MTLTTNERPVVSRREAVARGLPRYFTGKPCAQGHIDTRLTADRKCESCNRMRSKAWRAKNPDKVQALNATYYIAERERLKAAQRAWNAGNSEYAAEYARQYRAANPDVARIWRQRNKQRTVWYTTSRRAAKLQRTPSWADKFAIRRFYLACPEGYQVDHIVPLRGRLVSGLHVLNNLQYLTKEANTRKLNKFDPWTFNDGQTS